LGPLWLLLVICWTLMLGNALKMIFTVRLVWEFMVVLVGKQFPSSCYVQEISFPTYWRFGCFSPPLMSWRIWVRLSSGIPKS
jgi:hypothetical protein